ncbi:MAG: sigma-70 family polymerase sigma factor [Spirosoma sp.]|nr:sigma-70 family polymerase sigma factor [Spirosoma sp.]
MVQDLSGLADKELISRVLLGEARLFEILIRRMNPFLYKVGRTYGYSHADIQDLMQDTLVMAYQSLDKFEYRSSFKTWIIRIMLNHCYQKKKKPGFSRELISESSYETAIPMFSQYSDHDPARMCLNRELKEVIEQAITEIPLDYRLVFTLRELNGLSTAETSEALSMPEVTVKVRLHRARIMLRKAVEKRYTAEDIFEFNRVYCDAMVERVMTKLTPYPRLKRITDPT